jgi:hypothetical protein
MPGLVSKASDIDIKYTQIFINNEWRKSTNGKTFPVINPSTGEEICRVEEATKVCTYVHDLFLYNYLFAFASLE